jgi:hypothetical protein
MADHDRREVRPDHLLRAALDDGLVVDVLDALGAPAPAVRATLEHRWLETLDDVDAEALFSLGIELDNVLEVLNPPYDAEPDWHGRLLSPAARDVLLSALVEYSAIRGPRIHAGHLLLGLLRSHDALVTATFRTHHVRLRPARALVAEWGRRAG